METAASETDISNKRASAVSPVSIKPKDIYKVYVCETGAKIRSVIVFSGGLKSAADLDELFSEMEASAIRAGVVSVSFSDFQIHPDDSIRNIKRKIIHEIGASKISYPELYLFAAATEKINVLETYQEITVRDSAERVTAAQSKTRAKQVHEDRDLTKEMFAQLIENFEVSKDKIDAMPVKAVYSYDDLLSLFGENEPYAAFKIPVGQKFSNAPDPLFSANPFNIINNTASRFSLSVENALLSFENHLLLNYGAIRDNSLYLCCAEDVFNYAFETGIGEEYIAPIYFPLLYKNSVSNSLQLREKRGAMVGENAELITKPVLEYFRMIDTLYTLYSNKRAEIPYLTSGIQNIRFAIRSNLANPIPLDSVFKIVHATKNVPFVIYNPGARKENICRLYSSKISKNGKKIPYLGETACLRLVRDLGKAKTVSFYIQYAHSAALEPVDVLAFLSKEGDMVVQSDPKAPMEIAAWNELLAEVLNPIIDDINSLIKQSGTEIRRFESLLSENIEIMALQFSQSVVVEHDIILKKQMKCISSIFDVVEDKLSSGIVMRFKHVENYKEMNAHYIVITETMRKTGNPREAIAALLESDPNLSEEDANAVFVRYASEYSQIRGKVVDNPGFLTTFSLMPMEKKITIKVENVASLSYVDVLKVYIDSILCTTQFQDIIHPDLVRDLNSYCHTFSSPEKNADVSRFATVISVAPPESEFGEPDDAPPAEAEKTGREAVSASAPEDAYYVYYDEDEDDKPEPRETAESPPPAKVRRDSAPNPDIPDADADADADEEPGFFYDYEEEEAEDDEAGDEEAGAREKIQRIEGGVIESGEKREIRYEGTSLKNPNLFLSRIKERDPALILAKDDGRYLAYSRICPVNKDRQPVILTDKEKEEIDKNHPGSYKNAIKYGSSPDNKFWYICPRYWCLKTNTSITKEEVDSGVCGGIIPKNAKTVPEGKYVYEFISDEHIADGKYIDYTPGFQTNSHPKGYCIPCCFKRAWESKSQVDRRTQCANSGHTEPVKITDRNIAYIIGANSAPIPQYRWGFLPTSIQRFFKINYSSSVLKTNAALIKPNAPSLLRYGVEQSAAQSFIGCIAEYYAYKHGLADTPALDEMREILAKAISLDLYIRHHNGALISTFNPTNGKPDAEKGAGAGADADAAGAKSAKYRGTRFYKSMNMEDEAQRGLFETAVASFENFKAYLLNPAAPIDHTYLWDAVTEDNPALCKGGLNLMILSIPDDDITDNVELICPTSAYSSNKYSSARETAIVLRQGGFYEPVFMYESRDAKTYITKTFDEKTASPSARRAIEILKLAIREHCSPMISQPRTFTQNIAAAQAQRILVLGGFIVSKQVVNYRGKTIGLYATKPDTLVDAIVPCFPSAQLDGTDVAFMDDETLWKDYETTRNSLRKIHAETRGKIPCLPRMKVIEDGLVVGILTATNQFVAISPPHEKTDDLDGIEPLNGTNLVVADKALTTSANEDQERTAMTKNILLESQFFAVFRTKMRMLLNEHRNRKRKTRMTEILESPYLLYRQKLDKIMKIAVDMSLDEVKYQEFDQTAVSQFETITDCFSCSANPPRKNKTYCLVKEDGSCVLVVPKTNLANGADNERMYPYRIADELVRYSRIRLFMFRPNFYLNLAATEYSIHPTELLIFQSFITHEYFKNLRAFNDNAYIHNIEYDTSDPLITQTYSGELSAKSQAQIDETYQEPALDINENTRIQCIREVREVIGNPQNSIWKRVFATSAKEIVFRNTAECSFAVVVYILQEKYKTKVSINAVKAMLWNGYAALMEKYHAEIKSVLKKEGKQNIVNMINRDQTTLEDAIRSETYYLTNLDLWIIAKNAKLPVVLFSSTKIKYLGQDIDWLFVGENINESLFFVRTPVKIEPNEPYHYHLITPTFKYTELKEFFGVINSAVNGSPQYTENLQSIDEFLRKVVVARKQAG
jgi:hypothetical protein